MSGTSITQEQLSELVSVLNIANAQATARISLFGGQVLSFCPRKDGRERLYLSKRAHLDSSKSIRGGIPVCWPWFGNNKVDSSLPAHGYVRNRPWRLLQQEATAEQTLLLLQAEQTAGPGFNGSAELQLRIVIGATLEISLLTHNTGTAAFPLSTALHTYFAVADIRHTQLEGLSGDYSDKTRDWQHFTTPATYTFSEETDRIHLQACAFARISMDAHSTGVHSQGHDSVVVWNPWSACAQNFSDMEADDYTRMLCVETALTQGFMLEPGATHTLTQLID